MTDRWDRVEYWLTVAFVYFLFVATTYCLLFVLASFAILFGWAEMTECHDLATLTGGSAP